MIIWMLPWKVNASTLRVELCKELTVMKLWLSKFTDDDLIAYPPSLVAASSILAVRRSFKMKPTWPQKLEHVSQYTEEELKECTSRIMK